MPDKILLFDLGGVLIKLQIAERLEVLRGKPTDWEELKPIWLANNTMRDFESGSCDPLTFARSFLEDFNISMSPEAFLDEFATWPVGFYDGAQDLLAYLRKRYTTACLSNTSEVHWRPLWEQSFDHPFASHLIGKVKPDADAFEHVLTALNAHPEQIYFFDDSTQNVDVATSLDFNAFHTNGFEALKAKLASLNFLDKDI
jgi:putative hydrolase of the HAD superfamily